MEPGQPWGKAGEWGTKQGPAETAVHSGSSGTAIAAAAVLVLTGIELISFVVANMGLRIRFVLKTVLINEGSEQCSGRVSDG